MHLYPKKHNIHTHVQVASCNRIYQISIRFALKLSQRVCQNRPKQERRLAKTHRIQRLKKETS